MTELVKNDVRSQNGQAVTRWDDWNVSFEEAMQRAEILVKSGMLPKHICNAGQAMAIMQFGRELGIPPMTALKGMYTVNGTPACDVNLAMALVKRAGGKYYVLQDLEKIFDDKGTCVDYVTTIRFSRKNEEDETVSFYWSEAMQMGVTSKENWVKHPKAMCFARCFFRGARRKFADAIGGLYMPSELDETYKEDFISNYQEVA